MKFVAVDIETTGFSHRYDSIISIGAVKIEDWKVVDEFSELIHTTKKIPEKITQITGITNHMLKDAKTYPVVLTEFIEFLGNSVFVAHNADFDFRFLNQKCKNKIEHLITNEVICTVRATKMKYKNLPNYKLNTVAEHLDIPNLRHHDALNDARVSADILMVLLGGKAVATNPESPSIKKFQEIKKALNNMWKSER